MRSEKKIIEYSSSDLVNKRIEIKNNLHWKIIVIIDRFQIDYTDALRDGFIDTTIHYSIEIQWFIAFPQPHIIETRLHFQIWYLWRRDKHVLSRGKYQSLIYIVHSDHHHHFLLKSLLLLSWINSNALFFLL